MTAELSSKAIETNSANRMKKKQWPNITVTKTKISFEPILPSGIKLKIPILEDSETIKFELPPWKK